VDPYSSQHRAQDLKEILQLIMEGRVVARSSEVPIWKRVLDIGCILFALPALVPLGVIIGLWIKISSPGPILFRQERIGLRGRRFICLKFRSMRVGADTKAHKDYLKQLMESNAPMTKMDATGDSRLIPFGALLRSTGLDELPQIINVWRGEMSLVGPRPCIPYEYEGYLPWQKRRFLTLPGLTGLWQVSGKNRTTFNEMIELDIAYVENQSLWIDSRIMMRTIPALLVQFLETRKGRKVRVPNSAAIPSSRPA
jgi:lipopolysaccharide/colanic/teichoic acid biosynthesis glycosyltransferase